MAAQLLQFLTLALIGFALNLIVEGLIYAIFPDRMKVLLTRVVEFPVNALRSGGLIAAVGGFGLIWALKIF